MKLLKKATLTVATFFAGQLLYAQQPVSCLTSEMVQESFQNEAQLQQFLGDFNDWVAQYQNSLQQSPENGNYIVPVVVHVIHDYGQENISDAQIADALRILNEDFNRLNPDWNTVVPSFQSRVADVGFEFRLAQIDPNGDCTNGITRTSSTWTYDARDEAKSLIGWPRNRYYNIWVVHNIGDSGPGIIGGYAYLPGSAPSASVDGIILDHRYTGSIEASNGSNFAARVITHESGHFFGLLHPWGFSACGSGCGDDFVADVPTTSGACNNCVLSQNTCNSLDNVENFMDYALCAKMFTTGQATRMQAAINGSPGQRVSLWQPSNLTATGTTNNFSQDCAPKVDFYVERFSACKGTGLLLRDNTWNATPTSWNWTITNGTTTYNSTDQDPYITFDEAGSYTVTLTVSAPGGNGTLTRNQVITIYEDQPGNQNWIYYDTFDDQPLSSGRWTAPYTEDETFGWSEETQTFYTWPGSVKLSSFGSTPGKRYSLVSPSYDFSTLNGELHLRFKYAYAKRSANSNDELKIYISSNCGLTWTLRRTIDANELASAGVTNQAFTPASTQEWKSDSISGNLLAPWASRTNVRVRFEFITGGGNNFYLDDINISGPTGIEEAGSPADIDWEVFPNPAQDVLETGFYLTQPAEVELRMLDVTGRSLWSKNLGNQSGQVNTQINRPGGLSSGMYLLQLRAESRVFYHRIVWQ